jgi:hypothetical protein
MFIASSALTKDEVLDYYSTELPKKGWEKEDPVEPNAEEMQNYCSASDATPGTGSFITCLGFVKDDVRLIVSAITPLQLNPIATQGVSFHMFLEPA